jgi:TrmH family RNA methyltransferase
VNEALTRLCIVMVGTTHPGNIGAAARAMKNMGVTDLRLVSPRVFPSSDATARASGANDVLVRAKVCANLTEAIADCAVVVGASARPRTIAWPELTPRECAERLSPEMRAGRVAVLFGREHSGLTNEELDLCQFLLRIPCNPDFSSLNVAAAVQVVTYEFRQALQGQPPNRLYGLEREAGRLASSAELESFYAHLRQALFDIGFFHIRKSSPSLMRRLRRLFSRAHLRDKEIHILRGILRQAQERIARLEKARALHPPDGNALQ